MKLVQVEEKEDLIYRIDDNNIDLSLLIENISKSIKKRWKKEF